MKNSLIILLIAAFVSATSCSPLEEKASLPQPVNKTALKFKISQKEGEDNIVYLQSRTPGVIPYWNYGSGTSTQAEDTVVFPFSGDYVIHYSASSAGGFVEGDSAVIHVTTTNLSYLNDPRWGYLTGGQQGKTWVLDMSHPVGFFGFNYAKHDGPDDWSWVPDYAGNPGVMYDRDWGSMTFDLNNGKNYTAVQIDSNGVAHTYKGTFEADFTGHVIKLNGHGLVYGFGSPAPAGVPPANYYVQVPDWNTITILNLTDSTMTLGVRRHYPPAGGDCLLGFAYKVKK